MTISHIQSKPGDTNVPPLSFIFASLRACWTWLRDNASTSTELDDLSEAQLEDAGMTRFARRGVWLDCTEAHFTAAVTYRARPDERLGSSRDL